MSAESFVTIKLFGLFREAADSPEQVIPLSETTTVADVVEHLLARDQGIGRLVTVGDLGRTFAVALDHQYAHPETPVRPGSELALIPPVSGG